MFHTVYNVKQHYLNHKQFKNAIDQEPAAHVLLLFREGQGIEGLGVRWSDMVGVSVSYFFIMIYSSSGRASSPTAASPQAPYNTPTDLVFSKTWTAGDSAQSTSSNYLLYSSVDSIKINVPTVEHGA